MATRRIFFAVSDSARSAMIRGERWSVCPIGRRRWFEVGGRADLYQVTARTISKSGG